MPRLLSIVVSSVAGVATIAVTACTAEAPMSCATAACLESALGSGSAATPSEKSHVGGCTAGYNFTGANKLTIPGTSLQIELAALPGCNQKFVLALFGGGWAGGHSEDMDYLAIPMLQRGIVYGSLEYSTNAPMGLITAEVQAALNAVRGAAPILGIDTNKMGIMGFSAGGQLAYQGGFADAQVRWIGGMYGPTDMAALEAADCNPNTAAGQLNIAGGICGDILDVMGGFPQTNPAAYQAFSPVNTVANLVNDPFHPGVFVGYSKDDIVVPPDEAAELIGKLQAMGAPVAADETTNFHGANLAQLSLDALNNAQAVLDSPPAPYAPPQPAVISAAEAGGLVNQAFVQTTGCPAMGADIADWQSLFAGKPESQAQALVAQITSVLASPGTAIAPASIPQLVDTVYLQLARRHATSAEITSATPAFARPASQCHAAFDQVAASLLAGARSSTAAASEAIYRSYNPHDGDHLYSPSASEGAGAGYALEGRVYSMFPSASAGLVPLYRCYYPVANGIDHFMTRDPGCEGQHVDFLIGYLETSGTAPVYRCLNGAAGTHLITTSLAECVAHGLGFEENLGFTENPASSAPGQSPSETIYRLYNAHSADHLYSPSSTEGTNVGYTLEGSAFSMYPAAAAGLAPIYRCYTTVASGLDHFMSNDAGCEGRNVDFLIGYLETSGTTPLYRCYSAATGHHLVTLSAQECTNNGFAIEGVLGYAN